MHDIFLIDYDSIAAIIQQVRTQKEKIEAIYQSILASLQPLEQGDWTGDSARTFFGEMNQSILPAIQRLIHALDTTATILEQCATLIKEHETDAAKLFQVNGNADGGGNRGNGNGGNGDTNGGNGDGDGDTIFDRIRRSVQEVIDRVIAMRQELNQKPIDLINGLPDNFDRDELINAIRDADFATRQSILNDPDLMAKIATLELGDRNAITAVLFEDALYWPGGSGPDPDNGFQIAGDSDFAKWMRGDGPPPTDTGTMNCWEFLMYSAYKNGSLSEDELRQWHTDAAQQAQEIYTNTGDGYAAVNAYYASLGQNLGTDGATSWSEGTNLNAGTPVFFAQPFPEMPNAEPLTHVAIATGRQIPQMNPDGTPVLDGNGDPVMGTEIATLWTRPFDANGNPNHKVQITTIEQMNASMNSPTVTYGNQPLGQ